MKDQTGGCSRESGIPRRPQRLTELWVMREGGIATIITEAHFRTRIYNVNPVGAQIWALCDGTRTPSQIVQAVMQRIAPDGRPSLSELRQHVSRFLDVLTKEWLIEWTSS